MAGPVDRDAGYDDWLDAVADDAAYYLECDNGHGSLPPRRVCPRCGADVDDHPLPPTGRVETYTVVHVSTPQLTDDTPYITAIAAFGPVRLTGFLQADPADAAVGQRVAPAVGEATTGDRALLLEPR